MTAEKELTAQRHLNRELKERIERLEIEARKKVEYNVCVCVCLVLSVTFIN